MKKAKYIAGFIFCFCAGYFLAVYTRPVFLSPIPSPPEKEIILEKCLTFSCRGGCPVFLGSADFEGNGGSYTIVKIQTAMTRGAGEIVIFDDYDGKVQYESGELPQIQARVIDPPDNNDNDFKQTLEVTYTTDIYKYTPEKYIVYFDEHDQKLKERQ